MDTRSSVTSGGPAPVLDVGGMMGAGGRLSQQHSKGKPVPLAASQPQVSLRPGMGCYLLGISGVGWPLPTPSSSSFFLATPGPSPSSEVGPRSGFKFQDIPLLAG